MIKSEMPEYSTYHAMKSRCRNVNHPNFPNYGKRGITVCERWLESFDNFLHDMGERPSSSHSLDRINNDGNYEPSNCRWTTRVVQNINRRQSRPNLTSGVTGVCFDRQTGKWRSFINIQRNGRATGLGRFETLEEAISARLGAESQYYEVAA